MPVSISTIVIVVGLASFLLLFSIAMIVWRNRRRQNDRVSMKIEDGAPPDDIYPMW